MKNTDIIMAGKVKVNVPNLGIIIPLPINNCLYIYSPLIK